MKKKILLFLTLITMFGTQPVQAHIWAVLGSSVQAMSSYVSGLVSSGAQKGLETIKKHSYVAATCATAAAGYVFAQWYWSPEKIQQRADAALENRKERIRRLYPTKIQPLMSCFKKAQQSLKTISQVIEGTEHFLKKNGDNFNVRYNLLLEKRDAKVLKGVMYFAGQEIKNIADEIYGNCRQKGFWEKWQALYSVKLESFLRHDTRNFEEVVADLAADLKELYESCIVVQIEHNVQENGNKVFNKLYDTLNNNFAFVYCA